MPCKSEIHQVTLFDICSLGLFYPTVLFNDFFPFDFPLKILYRELPKIAKVTKIMDFENLFFRDGNVFGENDRISRKVM